MSCRIRVVLLRCFRTPADGRRYFNLNIYLSKCSIQFTFKILIDNYCCLIFIDYWIALAKSECTQIMLRSAQNRFVSFPTVCRCVQYTFNVYPIPSQLPTRNSADLSTCSVFYTSTSPGSLKFLPLWVKYTIPCNIIIIFPSGRNRGIQNFILRR